MITEVPLKSALTRATRVVVDFMHGGLIVAGAALTIGLAALLAGSPGAADGLRMLRHSLFPAHAAQLADAAGGDNEVAASTAEDPPKLPAGMRAALEQAARRYRVSAAAIEPVFIAAQDIGRQLSLDPLLIVAVIGIESGFNPLAESVMGAQGLMQVIPRFHSDKLPEGDISRVLFDPETNVAVGARVLHESIRRMGSITAGLQQFAGAADDPEQIYASKVLAEKQRLELAARRARTSG